ncbi:MAG: hypothetical protein J6U84_05110 [Bacteroidales bacterium]|nr:hypothetical protein [Bacteroidales bacterium]
MGIKEKFNSILVSLGLREKEQEDTSVKPEDIVYNENIQGEFFGVPFGATKEEVIEGFAKHNLFPTKDSETNELVFRGQLHENGISFYGLNFGGFTWTQIIVYFSNNRFYYIRFIAEHNDKERALRKGAAVFEKLSNVYRMYGLKTEDPSVLIKHTGLGKTSRQVWLECNSWLTPAENVIANVFLDYYDENFYTENNEL